LTSIFLITVLSLTCLSGILVITEYFEGIVVKAETHFVGGSGPGNLSTIQAAVDAASSGDTIRVFSGIYFENVDIDKTISLIGNGSANTTIYGSGADDVVMITGDRVKITGFNITNSVDLPNSGIYMENNNNVTISGNIFYDNWAGVYTSYSENNIIINNTINYCERGMLIANSNSNEILNNSCEFNKLGGLTLYYSENNEVSNNLCNNNSFFGISNEYSNKNQIKNNNCVSNSYGIALYLASYNEIQNNSCNYNSHAGIFTDSSNNNRIMDNICNFNTFGIVPGKSNSITIEHNYIHNSIIGSGIMIQLSESIIVRNNVLTSCTINFYGDTPEMFNSHTIDTSNTVEGRPVYYWKFRSGGKIPSDAGQVILANCTNIDIENHEFHTGGSAVTLAFSDGNLINNNLFSNNSITIHLIFSDNNHIANNSCTSNVYGIFLMDSHGNTVQYNNFSNNNVSPKFYDENYSFINQGVSITSSNKNILNNNIICSNNDRGIELDDSSQNSIVNNTISDNNGYGIIFNHSDLNSITNNLISKNTKAGLFFNHSDYNNLYYNDLIQNSVQVENFDDSENTWDNGHFEGNYWSDYIGVDDGSGTGEHAISGDGIGDTMLPHLGLDEYPFTKCSGWCYPAIPILTAPEPDSDEFDSDGSYHVSWLASRGTINYKLEEDENLGFNSPTEIYYDSELSHGIISRPNGTYYYRLKAYSENYESGWSNIVDITVDWPPEVPKGITVSAYPEGNGLNLSWDLNEVDTVKYEVYYKTQDEADWTLCGDITHPQRTFNHTGLTDGVKYYYKLCSSDGRNQYSEFSENISGIPHDSMAPVPPTGLKVVTTSYDTVTISWRKNVEFDIAGYNIYRGNLTNITGWDHVGSILHGAKLEFTDSGLDELTDYYYRITSFDEVPNESNISISEQVMASTLLGPHGPEINNSMPDLEIPEDTVDSTSINLFHWFKDVNNDPMSFRCEGDVHIIVSIDQQDGSVTLQPEEDWNGEETIIFYVYHGKLNVSDNITITVTPKNDAPGPAEILSPKDGVKITEGELINFKSSCDDPDLVYGDNLTFIWSSNIDGELDTGCDLSGIKLSAGKHVITLTVKDNDGLESAATITVNVREKESSSLIVAGVGAAIIAVVIIILIFLMVLRKKRLDKKKELQQKEEEVIPPLLDRISKPAAYTGYTQQPVPQRSTTPAFPLNVATKPIATAPKSESTPAKIYQGPPVIPAPPSVPAPAPMPTQTPTLKQNIG
jgi:parallel beta-helix repeat protein